jgi:predicted DNA-binding transcriptional regulator YafY
VQHAVVEGEQIRLGYIARDRAASARVVHPLGLAAKGSVWYLIAGTGAGMRTFRVDRIQSVEPTGERVVRPEGFDLAEAWRMIADEVEQRRTPITARARVEAGSVPLLRMIFGTRAQIGPTDHDGRVAIDVRGHDVGSLAGQLAGLGRVVEVIGPPEVRARIIEISAELADLYR